MPWRHVITLSDLQVPSHYGLLFMVKNHYGSLSILIKNQHYRISLWLKRLDNIPELLIKFKSHSLFQGKDSYEKFNKLRDSQQLFSL